MVLRGEYHAKAKLFFSTIEGNGTYVVVMEQIKAAIKFKPKLDRIENGKTFAKVNKLRVLLEPEKYVFSKLQRHRFFNYM